jgi:hypothetical protein
VWDTVIAAVTHFLSLTKYTDMLHAYLLESHSL